MHLLHPFLRILIPLPAPPPYIEIIGNGYTAEALSSLAIWKAVMSSDPVSSPEDCVVMALDGRGEPIFCRPGDKQWNKMNGPVMSYFDVIYYKRQFIGITTRSEVVVLSEIGPDLERKEFASQLRRKGHSHFSANTYLVSSMGDLLQVIRYRNLFSVPNVQQYGHTADFEVFKLDINTRDWVEMKSLGDKALFLGYGTSISFLAHEYPGCKENAIYFTDDDWKDVRSGHEDLGIYNLGDGMIEPYYPADIFHSAWSPPLWLTPSPIVDREAR